MGIVDILNKIDKRRKVKFDSLELEAAIKNRLRISKLTKDDLTRLTTLVYDAKGQELTQHDIDIIAKYCKLQDLSLENVNLENKNIELLNVNTLGMLKTNLTGTNLGNLNVNKLAIRNCDGFEIDQLLNLQVADLNINCLPSINNFVTLDDLDKLKDIETIKKLSLIGIKNIENLDISQNVKTLSVIMCDIHNLEVLKKFKWLENIIARNNPYTDLSPVVSMENLQTFDADESKLGIENIDILQQLQSSKSDFYLKSSRTPLGQELNKRKHDAINQTREKEKIEIDNPELLTYLKSKLLKESFSQITPSDLQEYSGSGAQNFEIPSQLVTEFLDMGLAQKLGIHKLIIALDKENTFDVEKFLARNDKSYGLLSFKIDTPFFSLQEKDIELLKSRYGITYYVYGENYHIDEVMKMQEQINNLIPEFSENTDDFEKIRNIYANLVKNIELVDAKFINNDFSNMKFLTANGGIATGGNFIFPQKEDPDLQKVGAILKNKKANNYGINLLLNAMLIKSGFDVNLKDDTKYITFTGTNQTFSKPIKSNVVIVDDLAYDLKTSKDGIEFDVCVNQIISTTKKEKSEITPEQIKDFTSDIQKKDVQEVLGTFIQDLNQKKIGDDHGEI